MIHLCSPTLMAVSVMFGKSDGRNSINQTSNLSVSWRMAGGFESAKLSFHRSPYRKWKCAAKCRTSPICIKNTVIYCCHKFPDILFDFWNRRYYRQKQPACSLPHRFNVESMFTDTNCEANAICRCHFSLFLLNCET